MTLSKVVNNLMMLYIGTPVGGSVFIYIKYTHRNIFLMFLKKDISYFFV